MVIKISHSKISSSGKSIVFIDEKLGNVYVKLTKLAIFFDDEKINFDGTKIHVSKADVELDENGWNTINRFEKVIFPDKSEMTWEKANEIKKRKIAGQRQSKPTGKVFLKNDDWGGF